jgi:23S rRNA (cytosine1962-C5)-methyltransferase
MRKTRADIEVLYNTWPAYELLDSGQRRKLERFGDYVLVRSEPKAWWRPTLSGAEWQRAVATFDDEHWTFHQPVEREWLLQCDDLVLLAKCTDMSKHVGIFPEQSAHWTWLRRTFQAGRRPAQLLNLFGYTGIASLIAAKAGTAVTHVDASRPALAWARKNQQLSGLERAPVRWILDDALKFVRREINRQRRYDAIILDPPSFGRGPSGEAWKVDKHLPQLLALCRQLLSDTPRFIIVTMYALEASSLIIGNLLADMMHAAAGHIQVGELVLPHVTSEKKLPMAIFGRWEAA